MPPTQRPRHTDTAIARRRRVLRQSFTPGAADISPLRDDGLRRRIGRLDALDDDGLVARRRDEVQRLGGERLDARGRPQRFDFELQPPRRLLLGGALALHLLDLIAVAQHLEVLPGREQQDDDEEGGNRDRLPHLPVAFFVHFADDRVVADVLLDRVLEGFGHRYAILSTARSFALRARGFRATSASPGTIGFFVSTSSCASARKVCLTIRSSSEWNVITTSRAPARSRRAAESRKRSRSSSSRLTQMRSAWNVRVAGSIRLGPRRGIARRTIDASCPVVVIGVCARAATSARAMRRENRSSPY